MKILHEIIQLQVTFVKTLQDQQNKRYYSLWVTNSCVTSSFHRHILRSCAASLCTPVAFGSFCITSLHPSVGLSVFTDFHIPCTHYDIFLAVILSTCLESLIFYIMSATSAFVLISSVLIFSILFIPIIRLNILISVLSIKSCSAFLMAKVSILYIRTVVMNIV